MLSRLFLLASLFLFAPGAHALLKGKIQYLPAESLTVSYLSREMRVVVKNDGNIPTVDSTRKMTYAEFRLDTLVFQYKAGTDTLTQTHRIYKKDIQGFYVESAVVKRSTLLISAGVLAVLILFIL
jgi:hypothetical protein